MKGLGQRIKSLRKAHKLTLVEIAKKTGIDQATLSRIENGAMIGTLESHMKIAETLGLRLPDLYNEVLSKADEAKDRLAKRKLETFAHSSGTVAELLTNNILQKKMMPILLKIKAKGRTTAEEYAPGTERFIYVLKGAADIAVGKDEKALKTGESLYFKASLPHHFANKSKSECWCLSVMTPASL